MGITTRNFWRVVNLDLWLDEEEAKEKPNKKRIERFEKKFQELDREAQQHMGKAHRMAKKGKETKRKKYRSEQNQADAKAAEVNSQTTELEQNAAAEDPMLSDNEINFEETLSGVADLSAERDPEPEAQIDFSKMDVSEEELEATLKDDPEYNDPQFLEGRQPPGRQQHLCERWQSKWLY